MIKRLIYILIFVSLGWSVSAQTYLISDAGPINTCSGTLYDTGGAGGDYGNNEYYTLTICSSNGNPLELFFNQFSLESPSFDNLSIYDGPNTGSPIIVNQAGNNSLLNQTITSTGNCLTLEWTTDGSVTYPGFEATISCATPCQNFDVNFVNSNPPITNTDSMWVDVCQGTNIDFTVEGDYPNNNTNYAQSDATTNFTWEIYDGLTTDTVSGVGMTTLNYTFNNGGGYYITATGTDANGCTNQNLMQVRVRVSMTPHFTGVNLFPDTVCPGQQVFLDGYNYVTPIPWSQPVQTTVADTAYLPDGSGAQYTSSIDYSIFSPGQTLTNVTDLESICVNMEHSYAGDLEVWIECPNGQTMDLFDGFNGSGGGTFIGEPIDGNSMPIPGTGYDYCWDHISTTSFADVFNNPPQYSYTDNNGNNVTNHDYVPAGDYEPQGNWTDLQGCPLNGSWTIHVIDHIGIDNGYLFSWMLNINPALIPSNLWTIENTYDTTYSALNTDIYWTGPDIVYDTAGDGMATPMTPGVNDYVLHAIDDFGCEYDTTLSVFVLPFNDPSCCTTPVADPGVNDSVCGNSYTFNVNLDDSVNTVEWSQISGPGTADFGGQQTSTSPTVNVDAYGSYEFQLVEQNISPACTDTATVTITFVEIPNSQFTKTPVLCYGDSTTIQYIGNASAAANYNWDFDGGTAVGSGQGPISVFWSTAGNHDITLNIDENGCSNDTTQTILVPEELTHTLNTVNDPCFGSCNGSASLNVNGGTLPYNYSWGATNQITDLCAGDYGVIVTDQNGCTISDSLTITEPPELTIADTSTQNLECYNQNDGEIHITVTGGTGSLQYNWSDGSNGADRVNLPAGPYTVTVVDENNCTLTQDFVLTQPEELIMTTSTDQAVCYGQNVNLSVVPSGGTMPYTVYWDYGNGFFSGPAIINANPDSSTTYSVYVEDANGCSTQAQDIKLTVSPEIIFDLIVKDNSCYNACDGEALLNVEGGIAPLTYSWAAPGALYQNMCAGVYHVTVTDNIGCEKDTVFEVDQPSELIGDIYSEPASCHEYDDGLAYAEPEGGTPGYGGYQFEWPDGTTNDSVYTSAGLTEVTITDANGCRLKLETFINQPEKLESILNTSDKTICRTNSTPLSAQAIGGTPNMSGGSPEYDFYWTNSSNDDTLYVNNPVVTPDTPTVYTVIVEDKNGCRSNPKSVEIDLFPELSIDNILTSYDTVCPNDPAIIEVDVSGGNGGPYTMTLQDGRIVPSPFTVYPDESTTYIITLKDPCGTPSVKDSIDIFVKPNPPNNFLSDIIEGCPPLDVNFTELNSDNGYEYLWNFGDQGISREKNPTHVFSDTGYHTVSLTVTSKSGCENTRETQDMIYVYPKPEASFSADPVFVNRLDAEVSFTNFSSDTDTVYWFFNDGDSTMIENPVHVFPAIGEYEVKLIAESELGCKDTAVKTISVRDKFTFFAPNAFTPNGDGDNDFWTVYGNGIDPNEFYLGIYDRWGELVYETNQYDPSDPVNSSWDGTKMGNAMKGDKIMPAGMFYWYCKFKDYNGMWHEKEGTVHLMK